MAFITEKITGEEVMAIWGLDKEVPREGYRIIGEVPVDLREEWEDLAFCAQELYFRQEVRGRKRWTRKPYSMVEKFLKEHGDRPEKLFEEISKRVPGFEVGKTRVFAGWILANKVFSNVEFLFAIDEMLRYIERPWDFPDKDFPCMRRCIEAEP